MTTTQAVATSPSPSRRIAAEIRAEAARQGMSLRRMSLALGKSQPWMTRRVSITADVDITLEELEAIAAVLGTSSAVLMRSAGFGAVTSEVPRGTGTENIERAA